MDYELIRFENGGVELECDACNLYMNLLRHGRYFDTYPSIFIVTFARGNDY